MTSTHWEKVAAGRYASELHGHVIQAIRKDRPYAPHERPYMAVVDRTPIEPGAWSLNQAKTQAIQFVERQNGKTRAESVFKNGRGLDEAPPNSIKPPRPVEPPMIPDPVDRMLEPEPAPVEPLNDLAPLPDQAELGRLDITPVPGQFVISGGITDADLLNALNALRSTLELLREHAEIDCTVNLPPVLRL